MPDHDSPSPTIRVTLPDSEKPGERIGRYKLLQLIGEGGMGSVWMAEQEEPVRRRVALKVIKLGMDTKQVIGRFEAERQALALMDHPNIAKVLDAGATENGRPFFAMELVKGIPITKYCDDHKLGTEERLKLFTDVCHAIQHAHQKGIIHRDIKPSNILVTLNDGVPMPKVIDFGIAKATGGQTLTDKTVFTALEQFIGTPAYMSPEQAEMNSLDIDTRSDIYALGVLLYELLTGKTPFDAKELLAKGLDEIRRIIREEEPPRPSTRLSTLDASEQTILANQRHSEPPKLLGIIRGDLDWIVMKTLEKDRTRRYDTANGLAMDIQRYLSNEPIVARPPSNIYRFKKLLRRNKTAFAVAASLFIIVSCGVTFYIRAVRIEQRKTNTALTEAQENFRLARKAIQQTTVGSSTSSDSQSKPDERFDLFLEMYRKARAAQPADRELLLEYVRLLEAKSRTRWSGRTNIVPVNAEANLEEAISLLDDAGKLRELDVEERFLLAQICQRRVGLWQQSNPAIRDQEKRVTMPEQIASLAERAKSLGEQLVNSNPGQERFVTFWLNLSPQELTSRNSKTNLTQVRNELVVVEKLLERDPQKEWAIRRARHAHWTLGKSATNSSDACEHFRQTLGLHARLLRVPNYNPHVIYGDPTSSPDINPLAVCSSLLRQSISFEADFTAMTNLLAAAQAIVEREGNRGGSPMDLEWSETETYRTPNASGLAASLSVKIIYHLMSHRQFESAISFANSQLTNQNTLGQRKLYFSPWRDSHTKVLYYLQLASGSAAIHLGRSTQVITQLETLAGPDMLRLLHGSVSGNEQGGFPRLPSELDLRHMAAAVLDEAYISNGQVNQARLGLDDWFATFNREYRDYGERAREQRAFALCRRAAIEATTATPELAAVSRDEALKAIEELPDHDLYDFASLLAHAARNCTSDKRRDSFGDAALYSLKRYARLGARPANQLSSDLELRPLQELAGFQQVLALADEVSAAISAKLDSKMKIDVSDSTMLAQAAARRSSVRISGKIASARRNEDGFRLGFVGTKSEFSVSGSYGNTVPSMLKADKDLTALVGGILVFNGIPNRWGQASIAVPLLSDKQIESFEPNPNQTTSTSPVVFAVETISSEDLGKRLKVEGRVKSVSPWMDWPEYVEIEFDGTNKVKFVAVVPTSQKSKFERAFAPRSNDLVGATIQLAGVVEVLNDKPQILISDVRQIEVLAFAPPPATLRGDDIPGLASQLGKFVNVEGRVRQVSLTSASNAANIEIDGPEGRSLLVWVPPQTYSDLVTKVGQDLSAALNKNSIQISGRLTTYGGRRTDWKDRLQITLEAASNLQVVAHTTEPK